MATADALERRSRRRARRKLLWEAVIVLGATAIGALIIYLVYRHPIGSLVAVAGTLLGTWLLSRLQERDRFRHAIRMVATEVGDNAAEIERYEKQSVSMTDLQRRLSTDLFEARGSTSRRSRGRGADCGRS